MGVLELSMESDYSATTHHCSVGCGKKIICFWITFLKFWIESINMETRTDSKVFPSMSS